MNKEFDQAENKQMTLSLKSRNILLQLFFENVCVVSALKLFK